MRVGNKVWYAKRISEKNATVSSFSEPIEITTKFCYFTVMKATSRGYFEVKKYGETAENTWTCIANSYFFDGKIKEGDVFWVDGESPFNEDNAKLEEKYGNGCTATAVVKSVSNVNLSISIVLNRNQKQLKQ